LAEHFVKGNARLTRPECALAPIHLVSRLFYEPRWKWSTGLKGIHGTESCQPHHVGVVESGSIHIQMDDGSEEESFQEAPSKFRLDTTLG